MAADFHIPNTPKFNSSEEVEIVKQIFSLKEETIFSKIGKKNSKNYKWNNYAIKGKVFLFSCSNIQLRFTDLDIQICLKWCSEIELD